MIHLLCSLADEGVEHMQYNILCYATCVHKLVQIGVEHSRIFFCYATYADEGWKQYS